MLLSMDLMISSQVSAAAGQAGVAIETAMTKAALLEKAAAAPPQLVVLDLNTAEDVAAIVSQLADISPTTKVIAFGPHVHEAKLDAARDAGCEAVFSRGQFHRDAGPIMRQFCEA